MIELHSFWVGIIVGLFFGMSLGNLLVFTLGKVFKFLHGLTEDLYQDELQRWLDEQRKEEV